MYTLEQFRSCGLSLVIYHGDRVVFESPASDLRPLVEYLTLRLPTDEPITVFDKYIGRAAAGLMVLAGATRIFGLLISDGGVRVLEEAGIEYQAGERAEYLMGAASDEMRRWEKFSLERTPEQLLEQLKEEYRL